jgi:carboxypeptidase family protein
MSVHQDHFSRPRLPNAIGRSNSSTFERSDANGTPGLLHYIKRYLVEALVLTFMLCGYVSAQTNHAPDQLGVIVGTVTDVSGDTVPQAKVILNGPAASDRRTIITGESGFFRFTDLQPGVAYHLNITADGFSAWTLADIAIKPGQYKIVSNIQLRIPTELTTVNVTYNPQEVAAEQVKRAEKQRVLGVIPNFYVVYDKNPQPLTSKWKFKLALRTAVDPVTIAGVALVSSLYQAANKPDYGQGAAGYGKRLASLGGDGFADIMIGGAILPSLLHQDPRYFYQGTGTTRSRILHAVFAPFVAHGDNGKLQPNLSSIGGDLATAAIANAYYPDSNRGTGQLFINFGIGTAERIGAALAQEFLLSRFTHKATHEQ